MSYERDFSLFTSGVDDGVEEGTHRPTIVFNLGSF